MDICPIIYFLSMVGYSTLYYYDNVWLLAEKFQWHHEVVLIALWLLLYKYDLVPKVLRCPPFFMLYKTVASIILANTVLYGIYYQIDDLMHWMLRNVGELITKYKIHPDGEAYGKNENVWFYADMILSTYLLLWVVASTGYLPQDKSVLGTSNGLPSMSLRSPTICRARRRSKVR